MNEYNIGDRLTLYYILRQTTSDPNPNNAGSSSPSKLPFQVEVLQPFQPFTLAVVCKIKVLTQPFHGARLPCTLVLKVNDRRYCWNPRERYDRARPYSRAKELAYQLFLRDEKWPADENLNSFMVKVEPGKEGGFEASLQYSGEQENKAEIRAYTMMQDLQGSFVPTFYGEMGYVSTIMPQGASADEEDLLPSTYIACGMLLEYIPSITLEQFLSQAMATEPIPSETIAHVCNLAIDLMNRLGNTNFIYKDLRLEDILVAGTYMSDSAAFVYAQPLSLRCVAVDFANVRFRYPDETDEQWRRAREFQEEEEAIGYAMRHIIRSYIKTRDLGMDPASIWQYERSRRWKRILNAEEQAAYEEDPCWGLYKV